jgi:hypothetical protein
VAQIIYHFPRANIVLTFFMLPDSSRRSSRGFLAGFCINSTYGFYAWILGFFGYTGEGFATPLGR